MADFFSSLIDRAFERAPVLQWRRPSRFESAKGTASMPDDGLREITDPLPDDRVPLRTAHDRDDYASSIPVTRPAAAQKNAEHGASNAQNGHAGSVSDNPATPSVVRRDTRGDDIAMPRHRGLSDPVPDEQSGPVHKPPAPVPSIIHTEKVVIERRVEKESVRVHVSPPVTADRAPRDATANRFGSEAAPVQIRPTFVQVGPSAQPAKENSGKREAKHDTAAAPRKSGRTAPAVPAASVQPRLPPRPAMQAQKARALQGPPPIQVTIGRIEIRANAATSASPARNTRPAGPRLSLEDYLRSRSGGGA